MSNAPTPRKHHTEKEEEEIVMSTLRRLLTAIDHGDYDTYCELNDAALTAFEPEAHGALVEGLTFHKLYLSCAARDSRSPTFCAQSTIASPRFQLLGENHALVAYTRLSQRVGADGVPHENATNETRVFGREGANGEWICLHFHRSPVS
ncbi:hypothetical protein KFE25_005560 [Diacronema lutheri]|uniref:Calcium/calmodulin-dependent protein kinase II association-domain domain-containing protein n=1 Tax=Diacronema lutheri TaxID=2081491 RepID=A0A8J5XQJ0_DIALT|nr:hypothetical protein KFE25_005560 [Diacronema lutheri]